MMKDPSYGYKFYWLEAIVNLISLEVRQTTFDAVIDEMITNAWYSVREFHIHLSGIQADESIQWGNKHLMTEYIQKIHQNVNLLRIRWEREAD